MSEVALHGAWGQDGEGRAAGAPRPTEGAEAIRRAVAMLRLAASHGERGLSLKEAAAAGSLHRATAHRILRALADEGVLEQDPRTKAFRLGPEIFALGAGLAERFDIRNLARDSLDRLCEATEDTVYLGVRSGYDGLCVDMREGAHPVKTLRLSINDRWPLGVGAFSMPLLAHLPQEEIEEIVAHNSPRLAGHSLYAPQKLLDQARESRALGYVCNVIDSYPTMCGVGVPVLDADGRPIAALCVTAVVPRMTASRRIEIAEMLWRESRSITAAWGRVRGRT